MTLDELAVDSSPPVEIPTTRYRTKIDFVSPQNRRDTFELEYECFLGVSLENRNFEPARFHSLLEWVSRRFSKCKILIGDSIHRLTLESSRRRNIINTIKQSLIISATLRNSENRSRASGSATTETTGISSAKKSASID
jgi:tRNA-dependent cyclodipeptide synthase